MLMRSAISERDWSRIMLGIVGPIWLVATILHIGLQLDGRVAWIPLYLSGAPTEDSFPIVEGLWSAPDSPFSAIEQGDALVAVGGKSLEGRSAPSTMIAIYDTSWKSRRADLEFLRGADLHAVSIELQPIPNRWRTVAVAVAIGLCGFIALWRAKHTEAGRAVAYAAIAYSFHWLVLIGGPPWMTRIGFALFLATGALFGPLTLRVPLAFPPATAIRSRSVRSMCWLFALIGPAMSAMMLSSPALGPISGRAVTFLNLCFVCAFLALVLRSWIVAEGIARRQVSWMVLGCYLGLMPVAISAIVASFDHEKWWMYEASLVAPVLVPTSILIAILKFDFLDIDRLLGATASTTILVAILGAPLPSLLPRAGSFLSDLTSVSSDTLQIAMFFLVVLGGLRLESVARPVLSRVLFRQNLGTEKDLVELTKQLSDHETPVHLLRGLGDGLAAALSVERVIVYMRSTQSFMAVRSTARRPPPSFDSSSPFVSWIEDLDGVRQLEARSGDFIVESPDLVDSAILRELDAKAAIPIRRPGEQRLEGFVLVGWKRSGETYTDGELARMDALRQQVEWVWAQFERRAIEEAERELTEQILEFAPTTLADQIREGVELERGERDVSVFFVDIRGFTKLTEEKSAGEVFELINLFSEVVAEIIHDRGGMIIEFQGDCLMAVFGAAGTVHDKETQALDAGIEVVRTLEGAEFSSRSGVHLRVGVGVATGVDFVGDIECVDRRVWTVLGNTSNFASRLESLTKDLDAALVIDETTWDRAGRPNEFRRHAGIRVKGRSDTFSVYACPRGANGVDSAATTLHPRSPGGI